MTYSVKDFVAEVDAILEEKGATPEAQWVMGPRLQRLVTEEENLTEMGEARVGSTGLEGRVLHIDPQGRFRLLLAKFPVGDPTPVHSHYRWGVECGISGRERFTVWTQVEDDGSGGAKLEVLSDHHVERGDLGYWYDAPRNIHRQWAEGDEPSCLAILMGGDGGRHHIFDLNKETYSDA